MLYDSKMMKSFSQSFAFFHPPAGSRGCRESAWGRVPFFTAAFAS
jgi:hypothetical protein